ncbi:hypothetical protein LCGC14_2344140, partial [marine sediment metagenome]
MITTSSPGKIILFGEHAVVYDKLGIACSIDKRCNVKLFPSDKKVVLLNSKNLNLTRSLKEKELFDLYEEIGVFIREKNFDKIKKIYKNDELIPSFFVLASIFKKYGFKGLEIEIDSQVPKNLGSSSSVFSAISLGTLKYLTKDFSKKEPLSKRVCLVALPFLSLYRPIGQTLSVVLGSSRAITSFNQANKNFNKKEFLLSGKNLFIATLAVLSVANTFFKHQVGLLITNASDVFQNLLICMSFLAHG